MTARIFLKLLFGIFGLLLMGLVAVDFFASRVAESDYLESLTRQLGDKGHMAGLTLDTAGEIDFTRVKILARAASARLTLVARGGRVLADSEADANRMENHLNRPELREALHGRQGSSVRHSATIGTDFLYVAVPVNRGALRLAVPLSEVNRQIEHIRRKILGGTALAFLPAILLAALLARYLSARFATVMTFAGQLAQGNFKARLPESSGEFGQLARTLNDTGENLQNTVVQLETEHAELERLERIRKDFVINVSHELRTPLASIQGYTETLMDGALEDRANNMRFLGIIRHNAERLARLTADLLTLSRVEMKRQEFHFESYPVNEMLEDARDLVLPLGRKKQIRMTEQFAPDGTEVWCDPEAVSQVLSNLLDNAIKYTPEGGSVMLGAVPDGGFMKIFVRDSGAGIPQEDLPRLFERFYRVDKARSRELGGTGLGLSIVKHLVLAQGGHVWVESRVGEGSTFWFTLPMRGDLNGTVTAL